MHIQQLSLFNSKDSFKKGSFENSLNQPIFKQLALAVAKAFNEFSSHNITHFDKTCRSNMLNNLVVSMVSEVCDGKRLHFVKSLTNTRRSICLLDEEYLLLFKKAPVVNVKTKQDDLLKNQELNKHVLILTYKVDEFWSEITRLEFQYFSSPKHVEYTYDISHLMDKIEPIIVSPIITKPSISVKKKKQQNKKVI